MAKIVEAEDITTIFFEALLPEDLAETVAEETGAENRGAGSRSKAPRRRATTSLPCAPTLPPSGRPWAAGERRSAIAELRDVTVSLGQQEVLKGISLTFSEGEFVALLGSNGSGKTTLVRALLGLFPSPSGEVRLFEPP